MKQLQNINKYNKTKQMSADNNTLEQVKLLGILKKQSREMKKNRAEHVAPKVTSCYPL